MFWDLHGRKKQKSSKFVKRSQTWVHSIVLATESSKGSIFSFFFLFPAVYVPKRVVRPWYCIPRLPWCSWTCFKRSFVTKIIFSCSHRSEINIVHKKSTQKGKNNGPENRDFERFLKQQIWFCPAAGAKKWFDHQTNARNVFRNIKLPLGYNIMTVEDDLGFL